jgi:leucyl-tRNA synthetase
MRQYEPKTIEPMWQKIWTDTKLYAAKDFDHTRPKYYMLVEFPYPSGAGLHAGHAREYTLGDVLSRHKRMQGYNVLYPMGFDSFGLPTENYAIKNKVKPQDATATNVAIFRKQFDSLGMGFDWDREINTSDPKYYHWTQWLFLQFFKAGLAYQAEMPINWCPKEKTGLANEEVVNGVHERCGTPVEKKLIKQWMLKITAYADRLIEGLKTVDYPPRIADQQINWIGRSTGAEIDFTVAGEKVTVFTTRADTLAGATFLVLAPEHPLVAKITTPVQKPAVAKYVKEAARETELDRQSQDRPKTGVFTGATTKNPITGKDMPVWIADYVLATYGTGAIMAVAAHDARDYDFAKAFDLPVVPVIEPVTGKPNGNDHKKEAIVAVVRNPKTGELLMLDWGPRKKNWGGMLFVGGGVESGETDLVEVAKREIAEETGYTDVQFVKQTEVPVNNYYYSNVKDRHDVARMHGLLFELVSDNQVATQLDDGEKNQFKVVWVPENESYSQVSDYGHELLLRMLTMEEPYVGTGVLINSGQFDGLTSDRAVHAVTKWLEEKSEGRSATKYKMRDWIFSRQHYWGEPIPIIHCPKCGAVAVPDSDLPVKLPDVEHYEPTDSGESPLAAVPEWVNTTCPGCGGPAKRETDTMPNWAGSSWYYLRYMDPHNDKAFAARDKMDYWGMVDLYLGGMEHTTLHLLYSRFWHQFLYDQGLVPTPEPYAARLGQGIVLAEDGRKMSKSLGNVVNPTDIIADYGADALRLYILFMAPYDESTPWSGERLNGVSRFLYRAWNLAQLLIANNRPMTGDSELNTGELALEVDRATHKTLQKVHDDLIERHFNTVVSTLMEYVNFLSSPQFKAELTSPANAELAQRTVRYLSLILAPLTPHFAEELWHDLGETESIHVAPWPKYDPALIKDDVVTVVVQVNGKVRASLAMAVESTNDELTAAATADPRVAKFLEDGEIIKTIVVPRKLVSFVVK